MKKMLMMLMVCVMGFGAFAQESTNDFVPFVKRLQGAVYTGVQSNVLALLNEDTWAQRSKIYLAATKMLPVSERVVYARTIPDAKSRMGCLAIAMPPGDDLNDLLITYYSQRQDNTVGLADFDPSVCTKTKVIEFYELVRKNVPLTPKTENGLQTVINNLTKLGVVGGF